MSSLLPAGSFVIVCESDDLIASINPNVAEVTASVGAGSASDSDIASAVLDPLAPAVEIVKTGNGDDANVAPGVLVSPGSTMSFVYTVTNVGNVELDDVRVTDDQGVTVNCGSGTNVIPRLALGQSVTCTGSSVAPYGPYVNVGIVSGTPRGSLAAPVSASDQANVYGTLSIGDFVWSDFDWDGIQDAGEPGLSGVTVELFDSNGVSLGSVVTTAAGRYEFDGLLADNYTLRFTQPGSYIWTTPGTGSDTALDSDAVAVMPTSAVATVAVTLVATQVADTAPTSDGTLSNGTFDVGLVMLATLGDFVWNDTNHNGVQDAGEPGIPGVAVTLTGADIYGNAVALTTTTGADGSHSFVVAPGPYTVTFNTPAGYTPSPTGGGDANTDSSGVSATVTVGSGGSNNSIESGFYELAMIEGVTWNDSDGNGIKSDTEPVIGGVKVELIDPKTGQVVAVTTTDINGHYVFASLTPGQYQVRFTTPGGLTATTSVNAGVSAPPNGIGRVDAGFRASQAVPPTPPVPTGPLPATGSDVGDPAIYGGLVMMLGALLVVAARRRKRTAAATTAS